MTPKENYIEEVGLFYEQYGLPKMAGRILGFLIASNTDNNSFEEIQHALKASKGSISGNINLLLNQNMIVKHMVTGERKSYFKIALNSLENILESKAKSVTQFKNVLRDGLSFNPSSEEAKYRSLAEIVDYYEFLEKEIPLLRAKWEAQKRNTNELT
jgi:DNA-binding transcriptional regulator GbsR (MarR family)